MPAQFRICTKGYWRNLNRKLLRKVKSIILLQFNYRMILLFSILIVYHFILEFPILLWYRLAATK